MSRSGLKRVVKTVKGKKRTTKRSYWVRADGGKRLKNVSTTRARVADAAGWVAGTATNTAAGYVGRAAGRVVGGLIGLKLSPFFSPAAIPIGVKVGGFVGSTMASLAARPFTAFAANRTEALVAGGRVQRRRGSFWLRGQDN